jgi:N-acetylglucosamine kinase-like BadF-type ATPase
LQAALRGRFPRVPLAVGSDAPIALRAAIPAGPGILLIAGTGSVAFADNGRETFWCGGFGARLGDEGSAYAIGLAAAKLLARAYDGRGAHDETTKLVESELGVGTRDELLDALYAETFAPAVLAALAPPLVALAGGGNRAAARIVQSAAADLAELVRTVARRAGLDQAGPALALGGGLFSENSLLSYLLETRIAADLPGAAIVRGGDDPVVGAVRMAARMLE